MKLSFPSLAVLVMGGALHQSSSAQDALRSLSPLYVRSTTFPVAGVATRHDVLGSELLRHPDTAAMVQRMPGAAIVRNGAQTGILQLRGLSGDRVAVRVDGMTITPACPNHMDPPLHYAHPSGGDLIELMAGISPVSAGGDHIGGALLVKSAEPRFSEDGSVLTKGAIGASFLGNQDATLLKADLSAAGENTFFQYRGSAATADDLRYPGGTVSASGYDTTSHDLTGAWRTAGGFIAVDVGFSATRDAGTPALPMDMIKDDAWRFGITQKEAFDWGTLENRLYVHDIDHLMDNYTLRPVMPGAMAMESPAASRDYGWRADVTLPRDENTLRTGIDLHRNEFEAEQVAVSGMMAGNRRDTFADNTRSRYGAYVEWERKHSTAWSSRFGLRGDVVTSDADAVKNAILPPPGPMRDAILADQARFNSADRSFTDVLPAATAALRFEPDEHTGIELAVALKSRAPSLVERYLWTPLNASAGLADGRTYLGNLDLDPETSLQVALAITREGESWNAGITPFYQSVDDYIQGMPINRMANGQPVLQYDNIDRAELYGFELTGGWRINEQFTLDGSVSYVRGRNKENGDDLYRIAPLNGMFDLAYERASWEAHLEWIWADSQNRVAKTQSETTSPGYGILNLRVAKTFVDSVRVEVGVENLLDKRYADHLGGVNRVAGGDLLVGQRIPSAARFAYVSLDWEF
jgi:iron complex outermembrane receptor protein